VGSRALVTCLRILWFGHLPMAEPAAQWPCAGIAASVLWLATRDPVRS
jgi:hypothetical protein